MICSTCRESTTATPCRTCGLDPRLARRYSLQSVTRTSPAGDHWLALDDTGAAVELVEIARASECDGAAWTDAVARIRGLSNIRHPALPKVLAALVSGSGETQTLWMAREPVDLPAFGDGRRPVAEALVALTELLDALTWLHGLPSPLVVGAIRPGALRLRADGGVMLEELVFLPRPSSTDAPDAFRAPEQDDGPAEVQSDLYSAAALATWLMTGRPARELRDGRAGLTLGGGIRLEPGVLPLLDALLRPRPLGRPTDARSALDHLVRVWPGAAAWVNKGRRLRADVEEDDGLPTPSPATNAVHTSATWEDAPPPPSGLARSLGMLSTPAWVGATFATVLTAAMVVANPIGSGGRPSAGQDGASAAVYAQLEESQALRICGERWRADHPDADPSEPSLSVSILGDGAFRARPDASLDSDLYADQTQCTASALDGLPGFGSEVREGARRLVRVKLSVGAGGTRVVSQSWAVDRM